PRLRGGEAIFRLCLCRAVDAHRMAAKLDFHGFRVEPAVGRVATRICRSITNSLDWHIWCVGNAGAPGRGADVAVGLLSKVKPSEPDWTTYRPALPMVAYGSDAIRAHSPFRHRKPERRLSLWEDHPDHRR